MRRYRWVALALAIIAIATLVPDRSATIAVAVCLLCGDRGLADALLNLALFAPLGAAMAARGTRPFRILLYGVLASLVVELLQVVIPGRNPSLGDLLFNGLGAFAGAWLIAIVRWWRGRMRAPRWWEAYVWSGTAVLAVAAGSLLLRPDFPHRTYYGQWTPEFENMDRYSGRVMSAVIAAMRIRSSAVRRSDELRALLLSGEPIQVTVNAGIPPRREAPVFNIYDDRQQEIVSIAVQQHDILVRYRTLAKRVRLDQPTLRFVNALEHVGPGEQWTIELRGFDRGLCLTVLGRNECPSGYTAARSWTLLLSPPLDPATERIVDFAWLLFLFIPAGTLLANPRQLALAAAFSVVGLLVVSRTGALLPMRWESLLAGVAGLAVGVLIRRFARSAAPERVECVHQ